MSSRLTSRWQHWIFPCFGRRLVEGRAWYGRHLPIIAWWYYASAAWVSPRLVILAALGLGPTIGLMMMGILHPAMFLGFAVTALIIVGWITTGLLKPKLSVAVSYPHLVMSGTTFRLTYRIQNLGKRAALDIDLDALPYPHLLELKFRSASVPFLPAHEEAIAEGQATAMRRGRYRLQPLRWDTDFPFGLWRWGKTDWRDRMLSVYPAYTPLRMLTIPSGTRHRQETHTASHLTREALEFHGCREYRTGDVMRHVHPRSSARMGVPVVKEFQAEGRGRIAVALDTWHRFPLAGRAAVRDARVEAILSLSAAIMDHLARSDQTLEMMAAGPSLYRFESAGQLGYLEEALELLAALEPAHHDPLPSWAPHLLAELREIQSLILILGRWDETRAQLVEELQASQIGLKLILVHGRHKPVLADPPADTVWVHQQAIRRGEVALL